MHYVFSWWLQDLTIQSAMSKLFRLETKLIAITAEAYLSEAVIECILLAPHASGPTA